MSTHADVLVVGGGPAGASTAFHLARRGARVVLLDRARFPRDKPCAECLSPEASRVLDAMGALPGLERAGAWLRGMMVRAPDGTWMRGDYVAAHGFRGYRDAGLSVRRDVLDAVLLDRARDAGVEVLEGARVTDVTRAGDRVDGVTVLVDGVPRRLGASLVVGADGLRSVVARRLGLARSARWPKRIALVAHYEGVRDVGAYGEMHIERDGFVGIADVGHGVTTVAAVFPRPRARDFGGTAASLAAFLRNWLLARPHLASRFVHAREHGPVHATGPFASRATRAWHAGALLVGDAADFFDPFTGEGIHAALRGGQLATDAALAMLGSDSHAAARAGRQYDVARHSEFGGKWWVERIVGACVERPRLANRAVRAMAGRKALADLLVGVTGDFVPPGKVLRMTYLAQLFLAPLPRPQVAAAPGAASEPGWR